MIARASGCHGVRMMSMTNCEHDTEMVVKKVVATILKAYNGIKSAEMP